MSLRKSSREFQFINTSNPEERTFLVRSMEKLQHLPDSSHDIECDNVIKRYQRRPKQLEHLCLADFVAWYNCKMHSNSQKQDSCDQMPSALDDYLPENVFDDDTEGDLKDSETDTACHEYELKGGFTLVKGTKPKIVRSVRFNTNKDPENYCREQLMLYTPWRNESKDLIQNCQSYQECYEQLKDIITKNREQYECHTEVLDKAIENVDFQELEEFPGTTPNTQFKDQQDQQIGAKPSVVLDCFDPGTNKQHCQYDLLDGI